MNKFKAHIAASETIQLKRSNGEEDTFTLKALPYKFMPEMFELFNKIKNLDKQDVDALDMFDKETVRLIQVLVLETLKSSYPDEKVLDLEGFAKVHLLELLPIIINLNSFQLEK